MRPTTIFLALATAATLSLSALGWSTSASETPFGNDLIEPQGVIETNTPAYVPPIRALRHLVDAQSKGDSTDPAPNAIEQLLRIDPATLSIEARIVVQNAAARLALDLDARRMPDTDPSVTELLAKKLVTHVALPQAVLERMATEPLYAAEDWLGPETTWVERTTSRCGNGPLLHERAFRGLLAFHPVRSGEKRALISKLVAFDKQGLPHVTPVIESIEVRLGMGVNAPAAILELDLDSLGGAYAALEAPSYDKLHETKFVRKDDKGGLTCTEQCHGRTDAWDAADVLDPIEAEQLRGSRLANILRYAKRRAGRLELAPAENARLTIPTDCVSSI